MLAVAMLMLAGCGGGNDWTDQDVDKHYEACRTAGMLPSTCDAYVACLLIDTTPNDIDEWTEDGQRAVEDCLDEAQP